jgi:dipeptidyl aminopeptidase/acylaminoacyl peptidase
MGRLHAFVWVIALFAAPVARAQEVDPAPFARDPFITSIALSPDGTRVAMLQRAPSEHQLIIYDVAARTSTLIQRLTDQRGSLNWVVWKGNDRLLLEVEAYGDVRTSLRTYDYSVYRVVSVRPDGSGILQMFEGSSRRLASVHASTALLDFLPNDPQHVLISAQDNDGLGVWRANVETGAVVRVLDGEWWTASYTTDGTGYPVLRRDMLDDGRGWRILSRAPGEVHWSELFEVRAIADEEDSPDFRAVGPAPGSGQVYVMARQGRDRLGLYIFDAAQRSLSAPLFEGAEADAAPPWIDRTTRELIATCENAERYVCRARDPEVQRHLNAVQAFVGQDAVVSLIDRSQDGQRWLLQAEGPTLPGAFYLYDLATAHVEPIALQYPELTEGLAPTRIERFTARDGQALWTYATARAGQGPRPMVVLPHGGPESRDQYGFEPLAQYLAAQGYVVIQPNFRGSGGFGRAFAESGYRQWGARMQDDVTDAVRHMIETGAADAQRICIVGASYGGYAALTGLAATPELYRCAVSIAGVFDLPELLRSGRASAGRSSMRYRYWVQSMGDPRADRDALIAASPARRAASITAPVLLIHGEDDQRAPIEQSELMDEALRENGRAVRFVRLPDSGHFWGNWSIETRLTVLRETSDFLNQHLGNSPPAQ